MTDILSEDSTVASIKRVMDNPGLAFLKQMHNPSIYRLVYGNKSSLYTEVMTMNPYRDKTTPFTVFMGEEKQISIERHYFIPKSINTITMYFFVYVLLRDRIIPFMYSLLLSNWDDLNGLQQNWFENKPAYHKEFKQNFQTMTGKHFFQKLKMILKQCEFRMMGVECEFKKVQQMKRHELIWEFEFFMGRSIGEDKDDLVMGDKNDMKINFERDPTTWLESIELASEKIRLFKIGVKSDISENAIDSAFFGTERYELMKWIGKNHVVIVLNKKWIMSLAMRLKKCTKYQFDIKASKNVSLNDCLSNPLYLFN